jgi:hypothetical protein
VLEVQVGDPDAIPDEHGDLPATRRGYNLDSHMRLIRAMQEGRVLFIDDATLVSPAVLAVAYPAMDGRREITVKAHPERS